MARFYFRCSSFFFWFASQNSYQKYHVCVCIVWISDFGCCCLLMVPSWPLPNWPNIKTLLSLPVNVCSIPVLMHHYQQSCCFSVVSWFSVWFAENKWRWWRAKFFLSSFFNVCWCPYTSVYSLCVQSIQTHTQKNSKNETRTIRLKG